MTKEDSDDYKVGDKEHNVKVAVKKIREAYISNDYKKYALQYVEAQDIILSAICMGGYTVTKEGDKK
jgi:hypothetical protein